MSEQDKPLTRLDIDQLGIKDCRVREAARSALYFALRSRVLTDAEMAQVIALDYHITLPIRYGWGDPYRERDKRLEFSDALLQQFKLRVAATPVGSHGNPSLSGSEPDGTERSAEERNFQSDPHVAPESSPSSPPRPR